MKYRLPEETKRFSISCFLSISVTSMFLLGYTSLGHTSDIEIPSNSILESENDTSMTEIYGIITDTGYVYFQAINQENNIVNLRIQKLFVKDSNDNEICLSFISGLFLPGDSLWGTFAPGEGNTLSYFTERYFFPCRPICIRRSKIYTLAGRTFTNSPE